MLFIFLIRRAIKRIKAIGYNHNLENLNKDGEPPKFLAVADVEVTTKIARGIRGRPSVLMALREKLKSAMGRNKCVFAALETSEGQAIFLLYKPQTKGCCSSSRCDDDALLEGATLDTGFATDRGCSVLSAENTIVKQKEGCKDIFVFEPNQQFLLKRQTYEIKIVVNSANEHSEANAAATTAWLATLVQE
jgi:hypothetical protein